MKENIEISSWTQDYYDENSTADVLERVVEQTQSSDDLIKIACHKNVSAKTLDRIVELSSMDSFFYHRIDRDILRSVIWNKNVSLKTLEKIVKKTDDEDVLRAVVNNDNATAKIKDKALKKINRNPEYESDKFFAIILLVFGFLYHIVEIADFVANNLIETGLAILFGFFLVFAYGKKNIK